MVSRSQRHSMRFERVEVCVSNTRKAEPNGSKKSFLSWEACRIREEWGAVEYMGHKAWLCWRNPNDYYDMKALGTFWDPFHRKMVFLLKAYKVSSHHDDAERTQSLNSYSRTWSFHEDQRRTQFAQPHISLPSSFPACSCEWERKHWSIT